MPEKLLEFLYMTGLKRRIFHNARLRGSWDANGCFSDQWNEFPMDEVVGEDGCPSFKATVEIDLAYKDKIFKWGVIIDGPQGANLWGIPTEVKDVNSTERFRQFQLNSNDPEPQIETYYLTYCRRLGSNKIFAPGNAEAGLRFAVWAPNAKSVDVVFGIPTSGYIYDSGIGEDKNRLPIKLNMSSGGVWQSDLLANFAPYEGLPYMYRIQNAQGNLVYKTDIFSRSQIGKGDVDPQDQKGPSWNGTPATLMGTKSCSIIVDPDFIAPDLGTSERIPVDSFWSNEFNPGKPIPTRIEDLVIYELHVGALGFGNSGQGTLDDAVQFVKHLVQLGINAVELMPMSEFSEAAAWGYGDTHHLCIESSAGTRDQYRQFVRECHRQGIAVIQDVVYNHYDNSNAERAEWQFDSESHEDNIYYWYEGKPSSYSDPSGGYLNNGSAGFTPHFWEDMVRQQFISAASFLMEEMHVDGFRVDLLQAMHRDNTLNADGRSVGGANIFGQKFLREWSRTLNMIRPTVMLIAEDYSGWNGVTQSPDAGGLGFDATWHATFMHNLVGDSDYADSDATRLLKKAGFGGNDPLSLDHFSSMLYSSTQNKIVYQKTHDDCGNAGGTARTIVTAVNYAPLIGATRDTAEARCRLVFGLSLLSAGTPMFFMAEEIGAQKTYKYDNVLQSREDILGDSKGLGARMFCFYQDLITLSKRLRSIRSQNIDIIHQSDANRIIVFKRWIGTEEVIIFASINNSSFENGYVVEKDLTAIPNSSWKEIFNSDSSLYGGQNVGNAGASIPAHDGKIAVTIPSNGFVVFVKQ